MHALIVVKKKSSNDTVIVFQESKFRETGVITPEEVRKTCFFNLFYLILQLPVMTIISTIQSHLYSK